MTPPTDTKHTDEPPFMMRSNRLPEMLEGTHVRLFFDEFLAREVAAHEEALKKQRKREDRYKELLTDYYYRSDHLDTPWDEAMHDMRKRSAYLDLKEAERQQLFLDHMATLRRKMGKEPEKESDKAAAEDLEKPGPKDTKGATNYRCPL